MKFIVESVLPSSFFVKQELYVQTCAHIEKGIWDTVVALAPHAQDEPANAP